MSDDYAFMPDLVRALQPFVDAGERTILISDSFHSDASVRGTAYQEELATLFPDNVPIAYLVETVNEDSARAQTLLSEAYEVFARNGGAQAFVTDPRRIHFTEEELEQYVALMELHASHPSPMAFAEASRQYYESLSGQPAQSDYANMFRKLSAASQFNEAGVDHTIAERFNTLAPETSYARLGVYGSSHFWKPDDIDERTGATVVAVTPTREHFAGYFEESSQGDLPHIIVYKNTGTVDTLINVEGILNTAAAARLFGIEEEELQNIATLFACDPNNITEREAVAIMQIYAYGTVVNSYTIENETPAERLNHSCPSLDSPQR